MSLFDEQYENPHLSTCPKYVRADYGCNCGADLRAKNLRLVKALQMAQEALQPFAEHASAYDELPAQVLPSPRLKVSDFQRARQVYTHCLKDVL